MKHSPWWISQQVDTSAKVNWTLRKRSKFMYPVFLLLLVALGGFITFVPLQEPVRVLSNGASVNPPTLDALIASCTGITYWPMEENIGMSISETPHQYSMFPPTVGTWAPVVSEPKFYDDKANEVLNVPNAVGNLWQGDIVVWYTRGLDEDRKSILRNFVERKPGGVDYVVAPWPATLERLWKPSTRDVVLTAWGVSQECDMPNSLIFEDFVAKARTIHEPGVIDKYPRP